MSSNANDTFPGESTKAALTRTVLGHLPWVHPKGLGPGLVAILRRDVVHAGLDPLDVIEWMTQVGGHEAKAYVREQRRATLHPEPYFAFPVEAFRPPGERTADAAA